QGGCGGQVRCQVGALGVHGGAMPVQPGGEHGPFVGRHGRVDTLSVGSGRRTVTVVHTGILLPVRSGIHRFWGARCGEGAQRHMKDENRTGGPPIARHLGVSAVIVGASAVLGSLLGLLWWVIAPRSEGMSLGDGQVFSGTTEDVFAGEGYFVLMTAVAGLVTGYLVYMVQFPLARRRMQDLRLTGL